MQIFLRILKEMGIAILILGLLFLFIFLLFGKQLPFLSQDIPNSLEYGGIDETVYRAVGSLEDETDPTKYYQSSNPQVRVYENEHRIETGLSNPFGKTTGLDTDMPQEKVSIENKASKVYAGETKVVSGDSTTTK